MTVITKVAATRMARLTGQTSADFSASGVTVAPTATPMNRNRAVWIGAGAPVGRPQRLAAATAIMAPTSPPAGTWASIRSVAPAAPNTAVSATARACVPNCEIDVTPDLRPRTDAYNLAAGLGKREGGS